MIQKTNDLPKLVTFDGEARSGKGTIVQAAKDYLRDEHGYKVMLIDAGQVFRVLVIAVTHDGIDIDNPAAIDEFLQNEAKAEATAKFVKKVYYMDKKQRDDLLYTNEVGANSAKIGARPLSQKFKDSLLKKWLIDAREEGFEIVLVDGRALEETGQMLEDEGLCDFVLNLYFICDPIVGARRTLGYADKTYGDLTAEERAGVDELVAQIKERNQKDRQRVVQPLIPPNDSPTWQLSLPAPDVDVTKKLSLIIDSSAEISKQDMTQPVSEFVAHALQRVN